MHIACTTSCIYPYSTRVHNAEQNIFMVFLVLKKVHKIYLKIYRNESEIQAEAGYQATFNLFTYDIRHWTNNWLSTKMPPSLWIWGFLPQTQNRWDWNDKYGWQSSIFEGLSEVASCQQKSLTPLTYLVSIGQLLCLAFFYGWLFLTKN